VIAEALIARGAELHVVLPTTEQAFIDQSVTPYGPAWLPRFRACMKAAASVREATRIAGGYEPDATALAADMAMGAALLNARTLESSAVQLLVIDEGDGPYGDGAYTARDGTAWASAGHAQRTIRAPRTNSVPASAWKEEGRADRALAAMLLVAVEGVDALDDWAYALALDAALAPWWAAVSALVTDGVHHERWGNARLFAFDTPAEAADFALRLHALDPPKGFVPLVAGHYGLVHRIEADLAGSAVSALSDLRFAAIPGAITVSEPFATALAIAGGDAIRTELVGGHMLPGTAGETRLFVLWRKA
jgi:hypothetical protein